MRASGERPVSAHRNGCRKLRDHFVDVQRSRAALREAVDRDAHLAGLVGEVFLDPGSGEDDDPDRHGFEHPVVALEWRGLGVLGPVGLEGDLRHLAVVGPGGRDAFGTFR